MHERHMEGKKKQKLRRMVLKGGLCIWWGPQLCSWVPEAVPFSESHSPASRCGISSEQQNIWKSEEDMCKLGAQMGWDVQAERHSAHIPYWFLMASWQRKAERALEMSSLLQPRCQPKWHTSSNKATSLIHSQTLLKLGTLYSYIWAYRAVFIQTTTIV